MKPHQLRDAHSSSLAAPLGGQKLASLHATQASRLVALSLVEYRPPAHSTHVTSSAAEYFPAGQASQVLAPSVAEYRPALQAVQSALVLEPTAVPNLPGLQAVHSLAALATEYFPAGQAAQVLAPGSEY